MGLREIKNGVTNFVGDVAEDVGDKVKEGAQWAGDKVEAGAEWTGDKVEAGAEWTGNAVKTGAGWATDYVGDLKDKVVQAADYDKQIDQLGPTDSYKLGLKGDATFIVPPDPVPVKVYAQGEVEVSRDKEGKYTVGVSGELGAGVYAQFGFKAGPAHGTPLEASATLGAGGKVEMKFDSAEEAKRATGVLVQHATSGGLRTSPDDLKFLSDHVEAIEVGSNVAAQISGEVGLGSQGLTGANVFAGADAKVAGSVRFEFPKDGPPAIVFKNEVSGKISGGAEAGLTAGQGTTEGNVGLGDVGEAKGELRGALATETRIPLPTGFDVKKALRDPVGAVRDFAPELARSSQNAETTTTLTLEREGKAGKLEGGKQLKLEVKAKPAELIESGALDHAVHGRFDQALAAIDPKVAVTVTTTPFKTDGLKVPVGFKVAGVGAEVELEGTRKDLDPSKATEHTGTPREIAAKSDRWLGEWLTSGPSSPEPRRQLRA